MRDRFMNGFAAGALADLPAVALDLLAGSLKLNRLNFIHFVSILAYEDRKLDIWEIIFTMTIQILFAGILGVIFNYSLDFIKKKYYFLKAMIFGASVWFFIYAVDVIFKVQDIGRIDFSTSAVHYTLSLLWGIIMAWILRRLKL